MGDDDDPVADLTDPRVVFELELQARVETLADADPRTYSRQAQALYDYHARLLALMEAEPGDGPGDAEQAVYDAQARKVEALTSPGKSRTITSAADGYS